MVDSLHDEHMNGRVIGGHYRVARRLEDSELGATYQASDLQTGRTVALELVRPSIWVGERSPSRVIFEGRALGSLVHPNILSIHAFGQLAHDQVYLVRDLVDAPSLTDLLAAESRFHPRRALRLVDQICGALVAGHRRGVLHRALKPDSVLIASRGPGSQHALVGRFGLAQVFGRNGSDINLTGTAPTFGSAAHLSPEQIRSEPLDERTDLYAVGVLMYQLLTGHTPFEAVTSAEMFVKHLSEPVLLPSKRFPELRLHPWVEELVDACLQKRHGFRVQSAEQLQHAVRTAVAELPPDPDEPPIPLTVDRLAREPTTHSTLEHAAAHATRSSRSTGLTGSMQTTGPGADPHDDLEVSVVHPVSGELEVVHLPERVRVEAPKEPTAEELGITPMTRPLKSIAPFPGEEPDPDTLMRVLLIMLGVAAAAAVVAWLIVST